MSVQAQCKAAVTFFHFCVLSNFSWLLVEALYLQSLLLFPFTRTRTFCWIYATVGWGSSCAPIQLIIILIIITIIVVVGSTSYLCFIFSFGVYFAGAPTVITVIWALMKKEMDDEAWVKIYYYYYYYYYCKYIEHGFECCVQVLGWPGESTVVDNKDSNSALHFCEILQYWLNNTLVIVELMVDTLLMLCGLQINFLIFVNISRTIVQKTKATHRHQTDTQLYRCCNTTHTVQRCNTWCFFFNFLCRPLQDTASFHSAPHTSVWFALRGFCHVPWTRECGSSTLPGASVRILSGDTHTLSLLLVFLSIQCHQGAVKNWTCFVML